MRKDSASYLLLPLQGYRYTKGTLTLAATALLTTGKFMLLLTCHDSQAHISCHEATAKEPNPPFQ